MTRKTGYQKAFKKYGADARSLQWKNQNSATIRYRQLVKDIDFNGKSVLDVGCGFGDIIPFIQKSTLRMDYTGVDITPEFVAIATKRYPDQNFLVGDYFADPIEAKFDVVITSGTLNFQDPNPYKTRFEMIKTLWEHSKHAVIFNMAGGYPQPKMAFAKRIFYADSMKVLEFCGALTSKIILRQDYHKKDFTVALFR